MPELEFTGTRSSSTLVDSSAIAYDLDNLNAFVTGPGHVDDVGPRHL